MVPPPRVGALSKLCTLHIGSGGTDFLSSTISFISHRPDRKGTLASDLKGAGARAPPAPLCTPLFVTLSRAVSVLWPEQTPDWNFSNKLFCFK